MHRLAAIEEARFAQEQQRRIAELERERLDYEASRSAEFSLRFGFRNSAKAWGRVIARNEGPADASNVVLEVWGVRDGERVEIAPIDGGSRGSASLLRPSESVSMDLAFTFGTPGPADLRYRIEWTDGMGTKEQEGEVPAD